MAFQIPKTEPTSVVAGDRLQWTRENLNDFPAPTWSLTYYFYPQFQADVITIVAAASGSSFSIDVAPATSADYPPGEYSWQAFVSTTGDRKLVDEGRLTIEPNPAYATGAPVDRRSWARRCRDNLKLVLEGKASRDTVRYVMQAVGRSEDKFTWKDIIEAFGYFEGLVAQEEEAEAVANGQAGKKNVLIRFRL